MTAIDDFVANSRNNNLSDDIIRQTLETQGWDPNIVRFALAGITVPMPDSVEQTAAIHVATPSSTTSATPSLHPLLAALHHVLLWFFVLSSTAAIVAVVASFFGQSVGSSTLAAFIAVVAVTFTPHAIFYILYLRNLRTQPNLVPGKVWSIITICFMSLGALGAAITMVIAMITSGEQYVIVDSALILALNALVLTAYVFAAFVSVNMKIRKPILLAYLPIIALMLGTLFVMSLLRLGPALGDETTRKNLVTTVENIQKKVQSINRLPDKTEAQSLIVGSGISYKTKTSSTYELCTKFTLEIKTGTYSSYSSNGTTDRPITDSYVDAYYFNRPSGNQCFVIESTDMQNSTYDKSDLNTRIKEL